MLCDQVAFDPRGAVPNRPQIIQPLDVQIARAVTPGPLMQPQRRKGRQLANRPLRSCPREAACVKLSAWIASSMSRRRRLAFTCATAGCSHPASSRSVMRSALVPGGPPAGCRRPERASRSRPRPERQRPGTARTKVSSSRPGDPAGAGGAGGRAPSRAKTGSTMKLNYEAHPLVTYGRADWAGCPGARAAGRGNAASLGCCGVRCGLDLDLRRPDIRACPLV